MSAANSANLDSLRKAARDRLLGAPKRFKSELVKVKVPAATEGEPDLEAEYEVRQPAIGLRSRIFKASGMKSENDTPDTASMMVEAILCCTFVPSTNTRVFEDGDRESLLGMPAGTAWLETLGEVAMRLVSPPKDEAKKKSEEMEKNKPST